MDEFDRSRIEGLAGRLGGGLTAVEPAGSGDGLSTFRISLADGRVIAGRSIAGPDAPSKAEAMRRRMTWLAANGLPVPLPQTLDTDEGSWLFTPWVSGASGSTWLSDPHQAVRLARGMGELARRIREVGALTADVADPGVPDHFEVDDQPTFVHGDFAPINVIVDPGGEIVALLDFEHAGPGPALLDVAWWGWVVRHHHPTAWKAAWPTFLAAAGLEQGSIERELHALALQALDARATAARDPETRRRWLDRWSVAERWRVPG